MVYEKIKIPNRTIDNYTIIKKNFNNIYLSNLASDLWNSAGNYESLELLESDLSKKYNHSNSSNNGKVKGVLNNLIKMGLIKGETLADNSQKVEKKLNADKTKSLSKEVKNYYYKNKYIVKADLELTYKCNLNCRHCYNTANYANELSTASWKNVMDQLAEQGCIDLAFTGGEVFARKDFLELLEYACHKEFSIRIKTNGALINKDVAEVLKSCKPYLLDVEISFYGTTAETFDWFVKREGAFEKVCNALKYLREEDVNVIGKFLVMKQNYHELMTIPEFCKEHDIKSIVSSGSMIPRTDGDKACLDYMVSNEDQMELLKILYKNSKKLVSKINCDPAHTRCSISPGGDVCSCEWLADISFGNILDDSLRNIWTNSEEIKKFRELNSKYSDECNDCKVSQYCGRCPARAYLETGDLKGKSPISCNIAELCSEIDEGNFIGKN